MPSHRSSSSFQFSARLSEPVTLYSSSSPPPLPNAPIFLTKHANILGTPLTDRMLAVDSRFLLHDVRQFCSRCAQQECYNY